MQFPMAMCIVHCVAGLVGGWLVGEPAGGLVGGAAGFLVVLAIVTFTPDDITE
jgi:hypothetical protein